MDASKAGQSFTEAESMIALVEATTALTYERMRPVTPWWGLESALGIRPVRFRSHAGDANGIYSVLRRTLAWRSRHQIPSEDLIS